MPEIFFPCEAAFISLGLCKVDLKVIGQQNLASTPKNILTMMNHHVAKKSSYFLLCGIFQMPPYTISNHVTTYSASS